MNFFGVIYILVLVIILYFFLKMVYRKIDQKWREGFNVNSFYGGGLPST